MSDAKKIKVTVVVNDIIIGGAQSVFLTIGSRINKEKFDFNLCYIHDFGPTNRNFQKEFEAIGISPVNLGKGTVGHLVTKFFRLYAYLRRERPNILHCGLPDSVVIGVVAGRLAGVKKIIVHEMNNHRFYSKKLDFFFEFARRFADLSITYEQALEEELFGSYQLLQEPITALTRSSYTIPNGIDLENVNAAKHRVSYEEKRRELGVGTDEVLIFSAARLIDWKGFEYLVRAMPEVVERCPSAVLLIAGEGEQEPLLRNLIEEFGLSKKVRLIGARTDVFEILAVSDIYPQAYAYPTGFSSISISMSGMEAMAFGLPIVASRYPGLYDHVEDKGNALIVEPRDIKGLAEALVFLIQDEAARTRIGGNARSFVERYFSSENIIRIYESVYRALLSR